MTSAPASPMERIHTPSVELPRPGMINQAAVLGAGTMGVRIAAHLANAGIPVVLLDLAGDTGKGIAPWPRLKASAAPSRLPSTTQPIFGSSGPEPSITTWRFFPNAIG